MAKPRSRTDETLVERWLRQLRNNPFIAGLIVMGTVLVAVFTFWQNVPEELRTAIAERFRGTEESTQLEYPETGWVFAGYVDQANLHVFASDVRVRLEKASAGSDRPYPFREGDVVSPLKTVPQVIADYRTRGTERQFDPPWVHTEIVRKCEDFTGRVFEPGDSLEVMDVTVSALPGRDAAVWLRVTPMSEANGPTAPQQDARPEKCRPANS